MVFTDYKGRDAKTADNSRLKSYLNHRKELLDQLGMPERKLLPKKDLHLQADSAVSNLGFKLALEGEDYLN